MKNFLTGLQNALRSSVNSCDSNFLALSGGLDSTIIAYLMKNKKPQALTIIAKDFISTDLTYCQLAAKELDIPFLISTIETKEILTAIEETIKILKNFNDIEIRNSIVDFLLIKKIKELGYDSIITGDGADELFLGYNFLLTKSLSELESERNRLKEIMHFPILEIAKSMKVRVLNPFLSQEILEIAKKIPTNLLVKNENGKLYGKWILRKAFEDKLPSAIVWRKKSPMQDGAGTAGLTEFFNSIIQDKTFEKEKKEVEESDNVIIRTKESLHYYRLYRNWYRIIQNNDPSHCCPYCKSSLKQGKNFCNMCGTFPI